MKFRRILHLELGAKWLVYVAMLILLLVIFIHFWISDRLGVLRVAYPFESVVAQLGVHCSPAAPGWMWRSVRFAARTQGALANQLAYIDPDGNLHNCESGWQGVSLLSADIDQKTRFRYASMTKLFTADAVLARVNAGLLGLDTRLIDVFPEIMPVKDGRVSLITIRHLLNHSAGFDRMKSEDPMFAHDRKPWCPYNVAVLSSLNLDFTPGERYSYSNRGYCILGVVLEKVTGKSYRDLIEREYKIREYGLEFVDGPYFADEVRYDFRNSEFYGENYSRLFDFYALSAVAGLSGNASSLAMLVKQMLSRKPMNIVSAEIVEGCDRHKFLECYGYGVYVYEENGRNLSFSMQGGVLPAVRSNTFIDSAGGVTVWLSNGMPLGGFADTRKMYELVYSELENFYQRNRKEIGGIQGR